MSMNNLLFLFAGTLNEYKHPRKIPEAVKKAVKPLFERLTKDELLTRCLGGFTQNNNESFNGMVWAMSPKILSSGLRVVEIAAFVSVCLFNDGSLSLLKIMEKLDITPGERALCGLQNRDKRRVSDADRIADQAAKDARQKTLRRRKAAEETAISDEGIFYLAGGFD